MADISPWHIERTPGVPELDRAQSHAYSGTGYREAHLRDYCNILLKHRWLCLVTFFALFGFGAYICLSATPMYEARAILKIDPQRPAFMAVGEVVGVQTGGSPNYGYYRTQFSLLRSRPLAARVIRDEGLADNTILTDFRVISSNPVKRIQNGIRQLLKYSSDHLRGIGKGMHTLATALHEQLPRGLQGYVPAVLVELPDASKPKESSDREHWLTLGIPPSLVSRYLSFLHIIPEKQTRLVAVSFTTPDPELSAEWANAHAATFIRNNLATRFELTTEAREFLDKKRAEFLRKLEQSEAELNRFRKKHQVISTSGSTNIVVNRMIELNKQLTNARTKRLELEALNGMLSKTDPGSLSEVIDNERTRELKASLEALEAEWARIATIFRPEHPRIAEIQRRSTDAKRRLAQEVHDIATTIRSDYVVALEKERKLQNETNRQRQAALELEELGLEFSILRGEVDANRALYQSVRKRLDETKISKDISVSNISITQKAEAPLGPALPKTDSILALFGFLGGFCAVGLAFFVEYFAARIETPDDVWHTAGLSTIGVIPRLRSLRKRSYGYRRLPKDSRMGRLSHPNLLAGPSMSPTLMVAHHPFSMLAEAFREIRTALVLSTPEQPPRVILTTSANPGEGKTLTSVNLAIALIQSGQSVLLIDADLRKGTCHTLLNVENRAGLSAVVTGTLSLEDAIQKTRFEGLSILTRGATPPNPPDLLASSQMKKILETARASFDVVVLDSPPSNAVIDAVAVSCHCDGVIIVVSPKTTTRVNLRYVVERLRKVHAPIVGAILNGISVTHPYYSHLRHYYTNSSYSSYQSARTD